MNEKAFFEQALKGKIEREVIFSSLLKNVDKKIMVSITDNFKPKEGDVVLGKVGVIFITIPQLKFFYTHRIHMPILWFI